MIELTAEAVSETIGIPVEEWPGNCYAISNAMVVAGVVDGIVQYGHWLGNVAAESLFAGRAIPFVCHGWIVVGSVEDEFVVDPTRYVFEGVEPYVFVGYNEGEYDAGGNVWRASMETLPPPFREDQRPADLSFGNAEQGVMSLLWNPPSLTIEHAFWLANLSLTTLGGLARPVYCALIDARLGGFIPIDNRRMVIGDC